MQIRPKSDDLAASRLNPEGPERTGPASRETPTGEAVNAADGHPRQELTESQRRIIDDLPAIHDLAAATPIASLEAAAIERYLHLLGQRSAPSGQGRVLPCYSASVATAIAASAFRAAGMRRVLLIHPTFSNIPDLLRGADLELVPLDEPDLLDPVPALLAGVDAVFVTSPNNPTGTVVTEAELARWAALCAGAGAVLAIDTTFRGFDPRAHYDHYAVLDDAGCRYVVIEDTGKLWPTLDLKAGFLAFSANLDVPVARLHAEIHLNISPVILALIARFADDAASGGLTHTQDLIARNRAAIRAALPAPFRDAPLDPDSRTSVERHALPPGLDASTARERLAAAGIQVFDGTQFHWARPAEGGGYIRVALSRRPELIGRVAASLRRLAEEGDGRRRGELVT